MKRIASLALTTSFMMIAPPAYADVNMMEASFRTTFIDLEMSGLKIQRRYDSRSNISGVFGFGWCSTFDTHLELSKMPDGKQSIQINDCGKFSSNGAVRYGHGTYVQTLASGLVRTYDADTGLLTRLRAGPHGKEVAIERSRNRLPRAAALGEGSHERQLMRLEFDELNETVVALETSAGKRLEFTYSPDRNLLSAQNAWHNTYRFDYDSLHNLTRVSYPDQTTEQMTYDSDRDRLLTFQGRDGCEETYSHQTSVSPNHRHQTSTARLVCPSSSKPVLKREVRFDFNFSRRDERWLLTDMSVTHDGTVQTTSFVKGSQ